MQCTGYSVVRGTDDQRRSTSRCSTWSSGDPTASAARGSSCACPGPAVDATGIGPGFSGSPIYCDPGDGVPRNIGAISESIGDYGGKVVLATPIEAILGTPVDAPATAKPSARHARHRAPMRALLARAEPLASPLIVARRRRRGSARC